MTTPIVHINGSSSTDLIEQYCEAAAAVHSAMEALQSKAAPHPRDYYLRGMHVFDAALREHNLRVEALQNVYNELSKLAEAVDSQALRHHHNQPIELHESSVN